jgi:hypothetical protein
MVLSSLGQDFQLEGRFPEAVETLTQSCEVFGAIQGDAVDLVSPLSRLADAQISLRRFGDAEASLNQFVQITLELHGTYSSEYLDAQRRLARVIAKRSRPQALALYGTALASSKKTLGEKDELTLKIQGEYDALRGEPTASGSTTRKTVN